MINKIKGKLNLIQSRDVLKVILDFCYAALKIIIKITLLMKKRLKILLEESGLLHIIPIMIRKS